MKNNFLFVCNLKMNMLEPKKYRKALKDKYFENLIICPNFCDIKAYLRLQKKYGVAIGAQNVSQFEKGSYTGDISAEILQHIGASYCIIGHSEQKKYHLETLVNINKKTKLLLKNGITPIVCVGEEIKKSALQSNLQADYAKKYVKSELDYILQGVDAQKVIVAYEPIWAIGTGDVPTSEHIYAVTSSIKKATHCKKVLYGGSFGLNNYQQITSIKSLDGALIGGASLRPAEIVQMLEQSK